ncbi:MAG: DUF11 domain-containing protein, partial [Burkholderiaceae bacterium]|nr:DUF11 domain-containing protein [Burkholderiaceae bacterium]
MKPTTTTPIRFVRRARWPAIAVMSTGALVAAHFVVAAPPPAGTSIGNQASATYYDGTATRTAQSTMVTTTVTQVGGFALDPNGAKTGAAGATLYVPHIITNSGNGTDNFTIKVAETAGNPDFTKIEVYPDANGDGLPDAGAALCSITTAGSDCLTTAQPATGNGGQFRFVIAYTIPPTATVGTWAATNSSTVTVESTNAGIYTGSHIQTLTDTITLTTGAALNVTKAITAPSASRPSGTWPVNTSGLRGAETTYTLTYSNSGGAAAPLYIEDTLPAGLAYVAGSAVWSGASGQALTDAAGSETVAGIDFEESAGVIKAVVANVPQGVTGTLSFVVTASPTAALGTSTTTNIAKYSATGCAAATNVATATCTGSLTDTGSSAFTVLQSFGTVFGISSTAPVVDTTPGTPATSGDRFDLASATAGSTHKFDLYVQNTGNGADVFDLTSPTVGGVGEFPAGTTFTWLTAGGVALLDSNGNGVQDTGSVAAGAIHHVVLQATLPLGLALNPAADYTAIVRATSGGDTGKFDATSVRIVAIVGSGLD